MSINTDGHKSEPSWAIYFVRQIASCGSGYHCLAYQQITNSSKHHVWFPLSDPCIEVYLRVDLENLLPVIGGTLKPDTKKKMPLEGIPVEVEGVYGTYRYIEWYFVWIPCFIAISFESHDSNRMVIGPATYNKTNPDNHIIIRPIGPGCSPLTPANKKQSQNRHLNF